MTNRNLHIAYVSQISRTIGKYLGLNTELIEAIALGHDLGHPPFGHDGEIALSDACVRHGIGHFHHNIESLHIVDHISRKGRGLNLTFPVKMELFLMMEKCIILYYIRKRRKMKQVFRNI